MIVRALRLRHGRFALPKFPAPSACTRSWQRFASTEVTGANNTAESTDLPLAELNNSDLGERRANPFAAAGDASNLLSTSDSINGQRALRINDPSHPVARAYALQQHEKEQFKNMGLQSGHHYRPHDLLRNPPRPEDVTLELLLASGAHLGHATPLWHPGNSRYIFGVRGSASGDPIHIISLDVTAAHLRRACKIVQGVAESGGVILFVGTRTGQAQTVVKAASMAKACHLFGKWIPGSITNGQQILGKCAVKVINEKDEVVEGFEDQIPNLAAVKPDLVICLNPKENYILLQECGQHGIPTIGIVDTDCNPTWVTYPIPANDDSPRAVQVIAGALGRAGEAGQKVRLEAAEKGIMKYQVSNQLEFPKGGLKGLQRRGMGQKTAGDSDVDMENDFAGVPVDQAEEDRKLLALLDGVVYTPPAVEAVEENALEEDTKTMSSADAAEESDQPIAEVMEEDSIQLRGRENVAATGSAAEDFSEFPDTLSHDEMDDLLRAYSAPESPEGEVYYDANTPVVENSRQAQPEQSSVRSPEEQAEDDAERLEQDLSQYGAAQDVHGDDEDSPNGVQFRVDNAPRPTATDPTSREESEDSADMTMSQVGEAETELNESIEEEEDLPAYQREDVVKDEKPAVANADKKKQDA